MYEQVYDEDGNPIEGEYVDQNNDSIINADDLIQGKAQHRIFMQGFIQVSVIKNGLLAFRYAANLVNTCIITFLQHAAFIKTFLRVVICKTFLQII